MTVVGLPATASGSSGIVWRECPPDRLVDVPPDQHHLFTCGTFAVPLDHDDPSAGTIELALTRRAGRYAAPDEEAAEFLSRLNLVPITDAEIADAMAHRRDYAKVCGQNAGRLLNHISTKDVARDLDLVRAAVGDEKLNYVGRSYSTLVGATYANLFPERVRAMILDGNVDPALRTNGGLRHELETARGFEVAQSAFLRACSAAGSRCAFSSGDPKQKFDAIRDHLRREPIGNVTLGSFLQLVDWGLNQQTNLAGFAVQLQQLYDAIGRPSKAPARLSSLPGPSNFFDSYLAVNCSDKILRYPHEEVPAIADAMEREYPTHGRQVAFMDASVCPIWRGADPDAYRGPWNRPTETPVLVIGNLWDPITQFEFSKRMAHELGNARLVAVDMHQHTTLEDSAQAEAPASAYLLDLSVPPPGLVLQPDQPPF